MCQTSKRPLGNTGQRFKSTDKGLMMGTKKKSDKEFTIWLTMARQRPLL